MSRTRAAAPVEKVFHALPNLEDGREALSSSLGPMQWATTNGFVGQKIFLVDLALIFPNYFSYAGNRSTATLPPPAFSAELRLTRLGRHGDTPTTQTPQFLHRVVSTANPFCFTSHVPKTTGPAPMALLETAARCFPRLTGSDGAASRLQAVVTNGTRLTLRALLTPGRTAACCWNCVF